MCRTIQNNLLTASQFPMGSFANFNTHISIQLCTFHHTYSYLVIFAPISHHSDLPKNKEISMVSNASTHNTASQAHNIKTKRRRTKLVFALGYWISVFLGIRSLDYLNEYRMRNRILPTMPRSDIATWFPLAHHRAHPHTKAAYLQSVRQYVQQHCQSCKSAIRYSWFYPPTVLIYETLGMSMTLFASCSAFSLASASISAFVFGTNLFSASKDIWFQFA